MSAGPKMFVFVTDFGLSGPYIGQMTAVLQQQAPGVPVVNLFADAPKHNPRATAYLLAAYAPAFPEGSIFLAVVDPGVGSYDAKPVIVNASERWFVGPDNGLFNVLSMADKERGKCWEITWRPEDISASFHGRDLYAPVAAAVARGDLSVGRSIDKLRGSDWPADLYEVIYIDHFGNAITGVRATSLAKDDVIDLDGRRLKGAYTFASVPVGQPFWYSNSNGLVELAVNQGRAVDVLGLFIGAAVNVAGRTI